MFKKSGTRKTFDKKVKNKNLPTNKKAGVEIVQNKEDFFKEKEEYKDVDLDINYDNFDIGNFFEEEEPSNITNVKVNPRVENPYGDKLKGDFDSVFSEFKKESLRKSYLKNSLYNDDLNDLMGAEYKNDGDIKSQFDNMSDEVKALLLSDFLKRKDD